MGYFLSAELSKAATEEALEASEVIIIVAGFILAFGAIGEYLEEHDRLPRWMAWPKLVFILMVVISLIGEFIGDAGVFVFSKQLQRLEGEEIAALDTRVKGVTAEANTVEKQAHDLSDLLAILRAQVRLQTPRWQLLEEGKSSFEDALRPFSGQPITVLTCGGAPEPEGYRLGQDVLNFIGKAPGDGSRGADWITEYDVWRRCGPGGGTSYGGNLVTVSNSTGSNVKRAASALKDILNKLGIYTVEFTPAADPYGLEERLEGSDSAVSRALRDPKSIFLLIGSNPMFNVAGSPQPPTKKQ